MDEERWEGHELANFVALEVPDEVPLGLSGSKLFALVDVFGDIVFAEMSDGGRLQGFGNGLGRMFFGDTDECDGLWGASGSPTCGLDAPLDGFVIGGDGHFCQNLLL